MRLPIHPFIVIWIFFLTSLTTCAQQLLNKKGNWFVYIGDNQFTKRFGLHTELQLRNFGVSNSVATTLLRIGTHFYVSQNAALTLGYGFIYNQPDMPETPAPLVREHRIWEQLILHSKTNVVAIEHRYRVEQRFLENITASSRDTKHRIRYRIQAVFPFRKLPGKAKNILFVFYNEVMLHVHKQPAKVFDRNRFYLALGYQLRADLNIQLGFMNQLAVQTAYPVHEINNLAQICIFYNPRDVFGLISKKQEKTVIEITN